MTVIAYQNKFTGDIVPNNGSYFDPSTYTSLVVKTLPMSQQQVAILIDEVLAATAPYVGYVDIVRAVERVHNIT